MIPIPDSITWQEFWLLVALYWIFSAAAGSLEAPEPTSSKTYRFWFRFLNSLAGNLSRAFSSKIPGANGGAKP